MEKNIEAWNVRESDFPHSGSMAEKLEFCLRYATLAPSLYNTQPWFFEIDNDTVSVYADRRYALPMIDPDDRELIVGCAAALFALRAAIRYFGHEENTQLVPNPADEDLLARVQIGEGGQQASEEDQNLFRAITHRQYNKGPMDGKAVPGEALARLKEAAAKENGWLHICEGDERAVVAHFIAEGDHIQMSNKAFRRELAAWINERRYVSGDGLPNYARNVKEIMQAGKPRIVRRFEVEPGVVVQDDQIADHSPVLAILGSQRGSHVNRLYAGQALMRVLLQAEAEGLAVSTLNQPCQVPDLRLRLYDEIEQNQGRAYSVLRIGYGEKRVNLAPRRPLSQVIEHVQPQYHARAANDEARRGDKSETVWTKVQKFFS